MTDQLQLRHWQQIKQAQALEYAGTPDGNAALAESRRYGLAADRIEELIAECGHDQRNAAASQRESAMLMDKCEQLAAQVEAMRDALLNLRESADDSDGCQYGTLSTRFVRDICAEALALPSTAAEILRQRDARVIRQFAAVLLQSRPPLIQPFAERYAKELERKNG